MRARERLSCFCACDALFNARACEQGTLQASLLKGICRVGQNHIYIRCVYGIIGRGITNYTVIYHIRCIHRLWPTLLIS